jgi:hypothetical protein
VLKAGFASEWLMFVASPTIEEDAVGVLKICRAIGVAAVVGAG